MSSQAEPTPRQPVAADTAAVMVSHNGERFLEAQCRSVFAQTLLPAVLIVVDDASRDGTRTLLADIAGFAPLPMELLLVDGSDTPDPKTRVAGNVAAGLAAAEGFEVVVLSDQDDEWLPDRVASQRAILRERPGALLVAGDGILIDEAGEPAGGRLRDRFPAPPDWETLDGAGRAAAALRRPFVTGAASALGRELAALMTPIPRGWLHDRWATLVAVARDGLVLQPEPVIRYRLHRGQLLGVGQAEVGRGGSRWRQVLARGTSPLEAMAHAADVVRRVRPLASDSAVRAEFSWPALLRSAADRP